MRARVVTQGRGHRGGRGEWAARALWAAAEAAVTFGLVVLLLVAHQLWWTNRQARADAQRQVESLERQWDRPGAEDYGGADDGAGSGDGDGDAEGDSDGAGEGDSGSAGAGQAGGGGRAERPRWDQAYAVLRIPEIGVTAPVAEGISKAGVLNKGYVGHYPHTDDPGEAGNFALAGHRNTHGEPFRHINRLRAGDTVEIETSKARYVYAVERTVPRTTPGDGTVLKPVPYSSVHREQRMDGPGYYLTLTTCTPEYTSTYRLVVWARLKSVEPR
ncbi:class E sortase [Streptomyces sp. NPDC054796]